MRQIFSVLFLSLIKNYTRKKFTVSRWQNMFGIIFYPESVRVREMKKIHYLFIRLSFFSFLSFGRIIIIITFGKYSQVCPNRGVNYSFNSSEFKTKTPNSIAKIQKMETKNFQIQKSRKQRKEKSLPKIVLIFFLIWIFRLQWSYSIIDKYRSRLNGGDGGFFFSLECLW